MEPALSATIASHRAAVARAVPARLGWTLRFAGAALSFGVYWIHVQDQGGFPGNNTGWMRPGYYALEVAAVLVAIALMIANGRLLRRAWLLAAGVALGPMVGYILTRSTGLPGDMDDKGNWTQPLGLLSLAVEGVLLVLALLMLRRVTSPGRPD
jgi:hypothetical protein